MGPPPPRRSSTVQRRNSSTVRKSSAPPSEDGAAASNGFHAKPTSPTQSSVVGERTVKKLRLSKALTIPEGTTVSDACRRMAARHVDAVLLTDANALISGIVTDKDIATRVIAEELRPEQTIISKVMTRNPIFVNSDSLAIEALQKMVQGHCYEYVYMFNCVLRYRNMSVSLKNCSEDTVSSAYQIPVIDLCSDDDTPVVVSHAKTKDKVKQVQTHDPPSAEQQGVKRMKCTHTNMPKFEEVNGQKINALVQPLFGRTVEEQNKGDAKNCAPFVVFIDTSDESSG